MTTPALTPLYDLALESLLDGELECTVGDGPATHLYIHGTCRTPICDTHAEWGRRNRESAIARVIVLTCSECGARAIDPHDCTITAI